MSLDVTQLITATWPILHSDNSADAIFVDDAEVTRYFADKLKKLAQRFGVFIARDTSFVTLFNGQQIYNLPPRHLSTMHVAYQGSALCASSTKELEALDDDFQGTGATAQNPISRFYEDKMGINKIGFYPVPGAADNGNQVEEIFHQYPCNIHESHLDNTINAPLFVGDYLQMGVVEECYKKESVFEMVEVAQGAGQLAQLYEQVMTAYWGGAQ